MTEATIDIHDSVNQILQSHERLTDSFYESFFRRRPDAKPFFADVNMRQQGVLLTMALQVTEHFYVDAYPATRKFLQVLGSRHRIRQIPKEMYDDWAETMIETLSEFHGMSWHAELESQWRHAIDCATRVMFEGYEKHFHV